MIRNRTFVACTVLATLAWARPSRADLFTGLQAYYQFDSGGADSSGNARGVDVSPGTGYASGLFGQALTLTGNTGFFAARPASDPVFNFGANDFAIQTWVNFNTTGGEQTLIEKFTGTGGPGWTLTKLVDNALLFTDGGGGSVSWNGAITAGDWHQVLVTRNSSDISLYYDGVLRNSRTFGGSLTGSTSPLLIGKRNAADGRNFAVNGRMDEVAIWNRGLSAAEVSRLYNSGGGLVITPSAIPEPSPLVLCGVAGVLALGFRAGRRLPPVKSEMNQ